MMQSLPAPALPTRLIAGRMAHPSNPGCGRARCCSRQPAVAGNQCRRMRSISSTSGAIGGPLGSALNTLGTLTPGVKALVGFISFVVALISLAALRNFGPVLYYIGVAIFATVEAS